MTDKRYTVHFDKTLGNQIWKDNKHFACVDGRLQANKVCIELNILHEENRELKCALALNSVVYIVANEKKIDIPPYYEFENYQKLKQVRREEYDEYW